MTDLTLLRQLPPLRRARGDRLYGADQRHWVDLWKQDGAWLLGHRPEGAAKEWKNQVDKGLSLLSPSPWPGRVERLVRELLPTVGSVRLFRNAERAPDLPWWRPWSDRGTETTEAAHRLVLPTGPSQAVVLAYGTDWVGEVPDSDLLAPADGAGLAHAVAQVRRWTVDARAEAARSRAAALFDRHIAPTGLFWRRGMWFGPLETVTDYRALFAAHLEAGFLLCPDVRGWSVFSADLTDGEWTSWKSTVLAFQRSR